MLGYKLPQAYVELMKMHNGGLGNQFIIDEWKYPAIGVVICDTPSAGHDMVFLDYRECGPTGEPCAVHVDQEYNYKITKLANDFEEFISKLCVIKNMTRILLKK